MFVSSIKLAKKAIFPVFRFEKISNHEVNIGVAGTAFFINKSGVFATVSHIFDNSNKNTKFFFYGLLPESLENPGKEIEEIIKDDDKDIFIGKIDMNKTKYLSISKIIPDIGLSVCISGYPLAMITGNNQGGLNLGGVRRYFQPTFILDRAIVRNNNGIGKIREHDGFIVRDIGLFGMSGGPVFDIRGVVVGIQGSVTAPRISENGAGRSITVENSIAIRSNQIIELAKKAKINLPV